MPDSDSVPELLNAAVEMFGQVCNEVEPYNGPERLLHMLFFRRFTEWQYEYCRAIRALYEANCFRGAVPILRSLVEVSVAQVLLQRDADFSTLVELLKGERVKIASALTQIEWPDSQNDIYARLSQIAHPSRTNAFLGRTLDFEKDPLKSLIDRQDIAGVVSEILWRGAPESEPARQERWVFVALNTYDVALSSLFTLYGSEAPERDWWDRSRISIFEDLAERYPTMKLGLLWFRLAWHHSKHSRLETELDRLLGSVSSQSA